eukprot:gene9496-6666_t
MLFVSCHALSLISDSGPSGSSTKPVTGGCEGSTSDRALPSKLYYHPEVFIIESRLVVTPCEAQGALTVENKLSVACLHLDFFSPLPHHQHLRIHAHRAHWCVERLLVDFSFVFLFSFPYFLSFVSPYPRFLTTVYYYYYYYYYLFHDIYLSIEVSSWHQFNNFFFVIIIIIIILLEVAIVKQNKKQKIKIIFIAHSSTSKHAGAFI